MCVCMYVCIYIYTYAKLTLPKNYREVPRYLHQTNPPTFRLLACLTGGFEVSRGEHVYVGGRHEIQVLATLYADTPKVLPPTMKVFLSEYPNSTWAQVSAPTIARTAISDQSL